MKLLKSNKTIVALVLFVVALVLVVRDLQDDADVSPVQDLEIRTSRMAGARVHIEDMDVDWRGGEVTVPGVTVASPTGFSGRDMVSVDVIRIQGDFEARVVERIGIEGIEVAIEFQGERSNIESVGERVVESAERREEAVETATPADDEASRSGKGDEGAQNEWRVERVEFHDITVSVRADWTGETKEFAFEGLTMQGLNGDADGLMRKVAIEFLDRVVSKAAGQVEDSRLKERLLKKIAALREKAMPLKGGGESREDG